MGKHFFLQVLILSVLFISCGDAGKEKPNVTQEENQNTDAKEEAQSDTNAVRITALDLNNSLVHYQKLLMDQANYVFNTPVDSLHNVLETAVFELKIYKEDLKMLQGTKFDYGKPFVKAVYQLNEFYLEQFNGKLRKILALEKADRKEALDEFDRNFQVQEQKLFQQIQKAQDQFAEYHKIELV